MCFSTFNSELDEPIFLNDDDCGLQKIVQPIFCPLKFYFNRTKLLIQLWNRLTIRTYQRRRIYVTVLKSMSNCLPGGQGHFKTAHMRK